MSSIAEKGLSTAVHGKVLYMFKYYFYVVLVSITFPVLSCIKLTSVYVLSFLVINPSSEWN